MDFTEAVTSRRRN